MLITHKNAEINHTARADLKRANESKVSLESGQIKIDEPPAANRNDLQRSVEQIDQMQDLINSHLESIELPGCGNLRSTKRKDVK